MTIKKIFLWLMLPLIRLIAMIELHGKMQVGDAISILERCQPGDVLLTRLNYSLANWFIRGYFGHASIVAKNKTHVIEAVQDGVIKTDILFLLMAKDKACLLRPKFCTPDKALGAALQAESVLGKKYDYFFEEANNKYFCSELVAVSFNRALGSKVFEKRGGIVCPQDFKLATKRFDIITEVK